MKKYRLKISRQDFEKLKELVLADIPHEAGAFALAGIAETSEYVDILVRRPIAIPKQMMIVQNEYHLEVSSQAINGLISLCESNKLGAVICHSHPDGLKYSPSDDHGEDRIVNTLRRFIPPNAPTASLLFTPNEVTGRVWLPGQSKAIPLSEIIIIDHYIHKIQLGKSKLQKQPSLELYDRQVKAFGSLGQYAISNTKVGIVGVGGTGSSVSEQLTRLGVGDIVLIDPDVFEKTNLTRVYGTHAARNWKFTARPDYKVDLVAANLQKINSQLTIHTASQNVVLTDTASLLLDRDVIFLCTDEHWGRSIVNQIAYQYLIPVINIGVRITSEAGVITNAVGVLDVLRPDKPCLWCKQFLRAERIAAESMPKSERQVRLQEGYVDDVDTKTPSVISFTTHVASVAVSHFIHMMTNYMGNAGDVSRIGFDYLTGATNRGTTMIAENCICRRTKGFGDLTVLPTVTKLES